MSLPLKASFYLSDRTDHLALFSTLAALYLTEDETKEAFPPYTGTLRDIQAALDAAELAVMYYSYTDIPPSPAETDRVVTDGPTTLEYDMLKAEEAAPPPAVADVPAILPSNIDLSAILASFKPQEPSAAVGYPPAQDYHSAIPAPTTNNYSTPSYQTPPPPPQQQQPYNGYNNGYAPPPPPSAHQPYPPPVQNGGPYGMPPPQNGPGPSMYGNGGQAPYDPYGPPGGYDRDGGQYGMKRDRPDQNGNGYDRDGKRGRGDWNGGGGGGRGGMGGKVDHPCKYFRTRNG